MRNDSTKAATKSRKVAESILAAHGDSLPSSHRQCSWAWNDVWIRPKRVLRVANTDYTGLAVEAILAPSLPSLVGHPSVLASGKTKGRCWILQQRVSGKPLGALWEKLSAIEARSALCDLKSRLESLHALQNVPPAIKDREPTCYVIDPAHANEVITKLFERGSIDKAFATSLRKIYRDFFAALAGQPVGALHGDLHLYNAMYDPSKKAVTGIIDFEDCGYGPLELDYYMLAKSVAETHQPGVVTWLRALLAGHLGQSGAKQRWHGYAVARVLGRTAWDPEVDLDGEPDEHAMAELIDDLASVAQGHHVGALLLS